MTDPKDHLEIKVKELKKEGKFEEAVEILDKIREIKEEEKGYDFWHKRAIHFCNLGEYEQAKDALSKELEINTKKYDVLIFLGKSSV